MGWQREITHQEVRGIATNTNWYSSCLTPLSRGFIFKQRFPQCLSDSCPLPSRLLCLSSQASLLFSLTCSEIGSHKIGQRMMNIPANYQSLHGQWPTTRLQSANSPHWQWFYFRYRHPPTGSDTFNVRAALNGDPGVWRAQKCNSCHSFSALKLISCTSPFSCLLYL